MPNHINFTLNGENVSYAGARGARLLDVLRGEFGLTGTKCGCLEGECGACSVIVDGKLINSCLTAMGSLEGADVMTIEGYCKTERFAVLDKAFEATSAVQCGYCIPGMVLASECLLSSNPNPTEKEIREGLSGNICRCTGYNAIVNAIDIASANYPSAENAPPAYTNGKSGTHTSISLKDALMLRKNPALIPYGGGTDLMVESAEDVDYLFLNNIAEMKNITEDDKYIRFGASCTVTDILKNPLSPAILKDACAEFAAPAIRNAGTIGGNISNGSPKADTALIFMVTDAKLRLASADSERILPIADFYLGRKKTALAPDELLVEVLVPKSGLDNYYYKKVGARKALSIARVSFAGILDIKDDVIQNCAVAFGAVSDVIIRRADIDKMLIGKTIKEAATLRDAYINAYDEAIVPIRGRVGIEYRKNVCMNLLREFIDEGLLN